jgi:hypothetical protein
MRKSQASPSKGHRKTKSSLIGVQNMEN